MQFNRNSRIIDVWRQPVGQAMLRNAMCRLNKPEEWPATTVAAYLRVQVLDKLLGLEYTDALLQALNTAQQPAPKQPLQQAWWQKAVGYQIYVPSFMDSNHDGVGDVAGILQRLPYLQNLGINLLWVSSTDMNGIDNEQPALYKARQRAETLEAMDTLIATVHGRDMRLIISLNLPQITQGRDWYSQGAQSEAWPQVCRAISFWVKRGVDGVYLQGLCVASDETAICEHPVDVAAFSPALHQALQALRAEFQGQGAPVLVGGINGIGPENAKAFTARERQELDMVLDTAHLRTPRSFLEGRRQGKGNRILPPGIGLLRLKQYYLQWMQGNGEGYWMPLLFETQDLPRLISRVGANPVYRTALAKMLATWMFGLRGTPLLFQGEELGLANLRFKSPAEIKDKTFVVHYQELCESIDEATALEICQRLARDHARVPMPWSTGVGAGFTGAEPWMRLPDGVEHLNASYQMYDRASVWSYYRTLIRLREENEGLIYGDFKPVFAKNPKVFCFFRVYEGKKWYIELNITGNEVARPGHLGAEHQLLLSNYDVPTRRLRPYEANLYQVDT